MAIELLQTLPLNGKERELYKQMVKQLFDALSTEDKLELLGPAAEYFKNEMIKQERQGKG
jgi:hypothetical protein